jgi:hypothetical protein
LIVLLILGIWSALLYNAGFYASFAIQRKWVRQLMGIVAVVGGTALALWDEVKGVQEFEQLCKTGGVYQIAPEAVGKKFDLKYTSTDSATLQAAVRPIEQKNIAYIDVETGKTVATAKAYLARPGWLVRNHWLPSPFGGSAPLFGRPQCFPGDTAGQSLPLHSITNKVVN